MSTSIWGIDYDKAFADLSIQPHHQMALMEWLEWGMIPGHSVIDGVPVPAMLTNIIDNNLFGAFSNVYAPHQSSVRGLVRFMYLYAPPHSCVTKNDGHPVFHDWPIIVGKCRQKWLDEQE